MTPEQEKTLLKDVHAIRLAVVISALVIGTYFVLSVGMGVLSALIRLSSSRGY